VRDRNPTIRDYFQKAEASDGKQLATVWGHQEGDGLSSRPRLLLGATQK
jgi:hypothetical protein